jgi:hypothetical protein
LDSPEAGLHYPTTTRLLAVLRPAGDIDCHLVVKLVILAALYKAKVSEDDEEVLQAPRVYSI